MTSQITQEIRAILMQHQDLEYKAFHAKIVPNISPDLIIGVRTPQMRKIAKQFAHDERIEDFLNETPHTYYEERNLHGFIISEFKDYSQTVKEIDRFLPSVDNWATCDLVSPKAFKQSKNQQSLLTDIRRWIDSDEPYTRRFGMEMLMSHFLDDNFKPEYLQLVASHVTDHYYVRMMVAWFFATALAKQYEATLPYIEQGVLPPWTHVKSIQKAIESYRVSREQKEYLRSLKGRSK